MNCLQNTTIVFSQYSVTMVVRYYTLLTLLLKFLHLAQLLWRFCPILTMSSRIWQTVEQPKGSQQNLVCTCMYNSTSISELRVANNHDRDPIFFDSIVGNNRFLAQSTTTMTKYDDKNVQLDHDFGVH